MSTLQEIWDFSSQSSTLMSIEFLVDNITRRHSKLQSDAVARLNAVPAGQFYFQRIYENLNRILSCYRSDYIYSEKVRAFWEACWRAGFLDENGTTYLADPMLEHMREACCQSIRMVIEYIPDIVLSLEYRRSSWDRRYQAEDRSNGLMHYIADLVNLRATTLVVRVDGGYRKESYGEVKVNDFYDAIERFRATFGTGEGAFENCLGYTIVVEQGVEREWHFHALFVFDASEVASAWYRGQLIGEVWVKVTGGRGTFFNCNGLEADYERRGINGLGEVTRGDEEKLQRVLLAARYLSDSAKDDQYLRMRPAKSRTFWKGRAPKHSGLGRPPRIKAVDGGWYNGSDSSV